MIAFLGDVKCYQMIALFEIFFFSNDCFKNRIKFLIVDPLKGFKFAVLEWPSLDQQFVFFLQMLI